MRGDFRIGSEVDKWVDSSGDSTDEQGMGSGLFKVADINPLPRETSGVTIYEVYRGLILKSERYAKGEEGERAQSQVRTTV